MTEGERLREEALARVKANTSKQWRDAALVTVRLIAHELDEFTTDDVWFVLDGKYATHEPRAMGAIMLQAARARVIVATDRYVKSARPGCHARPIRVWKSL